MTADKAAQTLAAELKTWEPDRRAALARYTTAQYTRTEIRDRCTHPAELAKYVDPSYVVTPAIDYISQSVERVLRQPNRNLLVTMPPQEGKSTLCAVWAPLRAMQLNPNCKVILATYADGLAEEHSSAARDVILSHGTGAVDSLTGAPIEDKLGLQLRQDRHAVGRWRIVGGKGGLTAVGLSASITGRGADLLIVDDPYKNMQEADSEAHRKKVWEWWQSVARTRLSPRASVIIIHTRWHPKDLAGRLMEQEAERPLEQRSWRHINIPAVSEAGIPDALGRPPGVAMVSAMGRSAEQFAATRQDVGERVWYALYGGTPKPPSGGIFKAEWFTRHRRYGVPDNAQRTVVAVDPAETGENDEAGIVAGTLAKDGAVLLTHDRSGHFTSDKWARAAIDLAIETGASEIAVESYTAGTTYTALVRRVWNEMAREDKALPRTRPFTVTQWREKGDAVARSAGLRQAAETGGFRVVGHLTTFEEQAAGWQAGQHQPDRVAAAVIVFAQLASAHGNVVNIASPAARTAKPPATSPNAAGGWLARRMSA